jgi:hypothetical protein
MQSPQPSRLTAYIGGLSDSVIMGRGRERERERKGERERERVLKER